MTARLVWSEDAELFLLGAPPSEAERILTAVENMVDTGRGFVRSMEDGTLALYISGYAIAFHETSDHEIRVDEIRIR